jgi:hypothetical protein
MRAAMNRDIITVGRLPGAGVGVGAGYGCAKYYQFFSVRFKYQIFQSLDRINNEPGI